MLFTLLVLGAGTLSYKYFGRKRHITRNSLRNYSVIGLPYEVNMFNEKALSHGAKGYCATGIFGKKCTYKVPQFLLTKLDSDAVRLGLRRIVT